MRSILYQSGLVSLLMFASLSATAHHSRAIYDQQRTIAIDGVVTKFEWANPHVYLYIQARSAAGELITWEIEHGSTTAMGRRGWSRDTFVAGDRIIVHANPAKDSSRYMALVASVEKAGVTYIGRGSLAEEYSESVNPSSQATSLTGTWVVPQEGLVGYFSEPEAWPVTAKGAEAVAAYDDLSMNPQIQCISRTAPWFMIFPSVQRIEVGDATVSIRSEYDTIERTVHLDQSSHDGATVTHQGHSIGWWEGETLVVDTTHFTDHRSGNARGVPSGSSKHLIERFELNADRTGLVYRFELADPEYLAAPVTGRVESAYRPDLPFEPVACDLDNARRFLGN